MTTNGHQLPTGRNSDWQRAYLTLRLQDSVSLGTARAVDESTTCANVSSYPILLCGAILLFLLPSILIVVMCSFVIFQNLTGDIDINESSLLKDGLVILCLLLTVIRVNLKGLHEVTVTRAQNQSQSTSPASRLHVFPQEWVCLPMVNGSISDFACSTLLSEIITCHESVSYPFPRSLFFCSASDIVYMNYICYSTSRPHPEKTGYRDPGWIQSEKWNNLFAVN